MYPGKRGQPRREFVALDEPPILTPDTPGKTFTLWSPDLGSLTRGSPISYHGVSIGEVEDYALQPDGNHVKITAFIRRLTRTWCTLSPVSGTLAVLTSRSVRRACV